MSIILVRYQRVANAAAVPFSGAPQGGWVKGNHTRKFIFII